MYLVWLNCNQWSIMINSEIVKLRGADLYCMFQRNPAWMFWLRHKIYSKTTGFCWSVTTSHGHVNEWHVGRSLTIIIKSNFGVTFSNNWDFTCLQPPPLSIYTFDNSHVCMWNYNHFLLLIINQDLTTIDMVS